MVEWRRGQHRVLGRIVPTAHANGRLGVGQGRERGSFGGAEWTTLERERVDGGRRQSYRNAPETTPGEDWILLVPLPPRR